MENEKKINEFITGEGIADALGVYLRDGAWAVQDNDNIEKFETFLKLQPAILYAIHQLKNKASKCREFDKERDSLLKSNQEITKQNHDLLKALDILNISCWSTNGGWFEPLRDSTFPGGYTASQSPIRAAEQKLQHIRRLETLEKTDAPSQFELSNLKEILKESQKKGLMTRELAEQAWTSALNSYMARNFSGGGNLDFTNVLNSELKIKYKKANLRAKIWAIMAGVSSAAAACLGAMI